MKLLNWLVVIEMLANELADLSFIAQCSIFYRQVTHWTVEFRLIAMATRMSKTNQLESRSLILSEKVTTEENENLKCSNASSPRLPTFVLLVNEFV